jgi:CRISPR-associated protein Cas1
MRKMLNTLYILQPEGYLSLDGNNVVVLVQGKELFRIPGTNIEMILCFSYLGASPQLMHYCIEQGIHLSFLTPSGKFLASVEGAFRGNVLLRKRQYSVSEDEDFCLRVSKRFIFAKIFNSRFELNKTIRDRKNTICIDSLANISDQIKERAKKALDAITMSELRGIEGDTAKIYFSAFDDMIIPQNDSFKFENRNRRPPTDRINALLSFGYSLLSREVTSAITSVGLDPYVGYLHKDRPGRESLALDLMEELRPIFVDRFVITLVNLRQLTDEDFIIKETNEVILKEESRKLFIKNWQERKRIEIYHPIIHEKIPHGLIPFVQASIFARFLRRELDEYVPYLKR